MHDDEGDEPVSAEVMYYQCRLRRGDRWTTRWIEQRGAKRGVQVEVLPSRELWTVAVVYSTHGMPESLLREHQRLNRGSLPSVERMA